MTDRERARCRARGAVSEFVAKMEKEIQHKSEHYQDEFLDALAFAMFVYSMGEKDIWNI